jgi:hypothetical protein
VGAITYFLLKSVPFFSEKGVIYSGEYFVQNRYFEFFCELGYILYKLNKNKKGDQIYITK